MVGDIGLGTRMKLVLNMFVGTTLAALAESLALSAKLGLNLTHVLDVLRHSSANSQFVQEKGGGICSCNYIYGLAIFVSQICNLL
jgi:3-hydroxyisobutyrate dehydrogenase-like beta-hydroxyacid dehydrogenase